MRRWLHSSKLCFESPGICYVFVMVMFIDIIFQSVKFPTWSWLLEPGQWAAGIHNACECWWKASNGWGGRLHPWPCWHVCYPAGQFLLSTSELLERLLRACSWFLSPFFENWSADELYVYLYLSLGLLPRGTTLQHWTDCKVQRFE